MTMLWTQDSIGWWDLSVEDGVEIASFQIIDANGNFVTQDADGARWTILWHDAPMSYEIDEETLPIDEYTEDEVRNHIELKYKLLKGERL